MNKAVNLIKRLIIFLVGMIIIQFGVALYLKTNIGSDPFTVFAQGLAFTLDKTALKDFEIVKLIVGKAEVTPGIANIIILVVLFGIIFCVEKKRIKIGTLICVAGVGPIIDFGVKVISFFPVESYNYVVRMLLIVFGCAVIAMGFSVLSAANIGVAPNDIIPFIIQDKTKCDYRWIRMGWDATFLVMGFVLGGIVGAGTLIAMVVTGPFIQISLPYGEKFVRRIVNEKDA